jgi:hypothetical protein
MRPSSDILNVGDHWYRIFRVVRFKEHLDPGLLREAWHCSHTFRKDDLLYFVREIPIIEYQEIR